jgi:hypothetical protein
MSVPFVLVRKGNLLALFGAAVLVLLGAWVGERLLKRYRGVGLAVAWVVLGGAMLALPFVASSEAVLGLSDSEWWRALTWQPFARDPSNPGAWTGWDGLWPSLAAGVVGAITCCFWFGWYLGVCFAFNGHNNEVGGAARVERFKQFVRFRLTDEGLTGYVIGINDPAEDGRELRPHVVDVFHLGLKPPAG